MSGEFNVKLNGRRRTHFTMIDNVLIVGSVAPRLTNGAFRLLSIALCMGGEYHAHASPISYTFLRQILCAEGGSMSNRTIKKMKDDLVAALPGVVRIIPGDKTKQIADTMVIDVEALGDLQSGHVAMIEAKRAAKRAGFVADSATNPKIGTETDQVVDERGPLPAEDLCGTPTIPSQPESKPKASKKAKEGAPGTCTDAQASRWLNVWNTEGDAEHLIGHRGLDAPMRRAVGDMIRAHNGDVESAAESWRMAVAKVSAVDCQDSSNWWGEGPKRPMISLLRNWSKHAVELPTPDADKTATKPELDLSAFAD